MTPLDPEAIQFASVMAHQLKAPVAAVVQLLETLLGEFAGPLTPKQRELLEKAVARCHESLQAAQRLMTVSQALRQPEAFAGAAELGRLLRTAQEHYAEPAAQRRIALSFDIQTADTQVRGAESALAELVDALVHNALKYTPDHGRVAVALRNADQPDAYELVVGDSGVGVPEAERDKLFEPFYRTTTARKSARPGTGLGLALVKTIAEAAGGAVRVGRSPLGGAEFVVTLPVAAAQPAPATTDKKRSPAMRVIIIGGVAAGPKVAAKVMRLQPDAEVTVIERGRLLSYAGCGLPFYISGVVRDQAQLMSSPVGVVRDPVFFQKVKNVSVMDQTEALEIDRDQRRVRIRVLTTGAVSWLDYDKLVLATGAVPVKPPLEGIDLENVFTLHGVSDAEGVKTALERRRAHDVVIIGGGLIGVETTEALTQQGCRVTILENRDQILGMLDWEMAKLLERHLETHGVRVVTEVARLRLCGDNGKVAAVETDQGRFAADMVILGTGVRPNTALAQQAGLKLGATGGIVVGEDMRTSDPNIYAAGDCVETIDLVSGRPTYVPLGSTANKQGRVVANSLCGVPDSFPGIMATVACKIFNWAMARTGLTETRARDLAYDVVTVLAPGPDREHFAPGARSLLLKLVVDRADRRLLGVQAIGPGHADKRVDVAAAAIMNRMTVDQVAQMDLCYSPNFAPVMDNLITAANIARNKLSGAMVGVSPRALHQRLAAGEDIVLLDVRTPAEFAEMRLPNSTPIPLGALRDRLEELPRGKPIVAFCNYSLRGYEAAIILRSAGFNNVAVLDGGLEMWPFEKLS